MKRLEGTYVYVGDCDAPYRDLFEVLRPTSFSSLLLVVDEEVDARFGAPAPKDISPKNIPAVRVDLLGRDEYCIGGTIKLPCLYLQRRYETLAAETVARHYGDWLRHVGR